MSLCGSYLYLSLTERNNHLNCFKNMVFAGWTRRSNTASISIQDFSEVEGQRLQTKSL